MFVQIMLCFNRTNVSEGNYVNKTSPSKECIICWYWYFLDEGFKFQPDVCNRCHGVLMELTEVRLWVY